MKAKYIYRRSLKDRAIDFFWANNYIQVSTVIAAFAAACYLVSQATDFINEVWWGMTVN